MRKAGVWLCRDSARFRARFLHNYRAFRLRGAYSHSGINWTNSLANAPIWKGVRGSLGGSEPLETTGGSDKPLKPFPLVSYVTIENTMRTIILLVGALTLAIATAASAEPVTVFVTSVGAVNGRTDPNKGNQDSVKDLQKAIEKTRTLRLVSSASEATIVLRVLGRNIDRRVSTGKLGSVLSGRSTDHGVALSVALEYDGAASELTESVVGEQGFGVWGRVATQMVKQIEKWVVDNGLTKN